MKDIGIIVFDFICLILILIGIIGTNVSKNESKGEISTSANSESEELPPIQSELRPYKKNEVTVDMDTIYWYIDKRVKEEVDKIVVEKEEETPPKVEEIIFTPAEVGEDVYVTDLPNGIFYYTDYRFYGLTNTPHWRMQQRAWTDELGCRRFNNDYIVALGSGYTVDLGERYGVHLSNGTYFTIIMGDAKADCDTDWATHTYMPCYDYDGNLSANILEFIIDKEVIDPRAYSWGGIHYYPQFKGDIIKMTYLGRDQSGDWDSYV